MSRNREMLPAPVTIVRTNGATYTHTPRILRPLPPLPPPPEAGAGPMTRCSDCDALLRASWAVAHRPGCDAATEDPTTREDPET